jgi:hypothetical protein
MGCAIETAATSIECRKLLGPVIEGTVIPDGFRVPGTELQVDPVKGAFDLGVLIRYLDHNDALGGAEWGHPSGIVEDLGVGIHDNNILIELQIISVLYSLSWIGCRAQVCLVDGFMMVRR